jgi:hypothetical protein
VNGQPPPPLPPPPPPLPAPVLKRQVPPPRQGIGCFAAGCLTVLILGFIFFAGVIGSVWFVCHKIARSNLISNEPAEVRLEQPSDAQFRAAESSLTRVKSANATGQEVSVAFTAADLNALLAREPDFQDLENRVRIEIENSTLTITLSAPLDSSWQAMKGRWFNGSLRFSGNYESDMFRLNLESARAGDYELPSFFLSTATSWINLALNENLDDWEKDEFGPDFWRHIKSIKLEGDKLVVTTQAD